MKRVVIVDDNNSQLMVLELLLNQMGIDPISFTDPFRALEYLKANHVDLLISDYKMPGMNGLELIFEARLYADKLNTAIVSGMRDMDGALQRECDTLNVPLLMKPFDALSFQEFMKSLIKTESMKISCIRHADRDCILRDKVATKFCMSCCLDDMEDEKEIIQSAVDVIEDFYPSVDSLINVNNKLSYMANTVDVGKSHDLKELFIIIKQLAVILHEFQERILEDKDILFLVTSYFNVISDWLRSTFLSGYSNMLDNYSASLKADFQAIEMALGLFVTPDEEYEDLDDLFF